MGKLKDALFELMQETPLEDLSIKDICAKAKIHRTTFYLKFKDKSSLFSECIDFVKRELESKISHKTKGMVNPVDFCNVVLDEVLTYTEDNKKFIRNLLDKNDQNSIHRIAREMLTDLLNQHVSNVITNDFSAPLPVITAYVLGGFVSCLGLWVKTDCYTKENMRNYMIQLMKISSL